MLVTAIYRIAAIVPRVPHFYHRPAVPMMRQRLPTMRGTEAPEGEDLLQAEDGQYITDEMSNPISTG